MRLPHDEKKTNQTNLRVKAINHIVVSILYSSTEEDQEKHQQEQSIPG